MGREIGKREREGGMGGEGGGARGASEASGPEERTRRATMAGEVSNRGRQGE